MEFTSAQNFVVYHLVVSSVARKDTHWDILAFCNTLLADVLCLVALLGPVRAHNAVREDSLPFLVFPGVDCGVMKGCILYSDWHLIDW